MKIISIANHKGGVAKSTSTHALGDVFSQRPYSYRVLMIDLDPQSTLTNSCGIKQASPNIADVFKGDEPITNAVYDVSPHDGTLHLLASDIALAIVEKSLPSNPNGLFILDDKLQIFKPHYDLILIDCPPSLSALVYNALIASHGVIIPTLPQISDMRGVNLFLDSILEVQESKRLNPNLEVIGTLVTMFDSRLLEHQEALAIIEQSLRPFDAKITRSIRVAEAPRMEKSIVSYQPDSDQANQYRQVANEVNRWLKRE